MIKRGLQRKSTGYTTAVPSDCKGCCTHKLSDEQLRAQEKQTSTKNQKIQTVKTLLPYIHHTESRTIGR